MKRSFRRPSVSLALAYPVTSFTSQSEPVTVPIDIDTGHSLSWFHILPNDILTLLGTLHGRDIPDLFRTAKSMWFLFGLVNNNGNCLVRTCQDLLTLAKLPLRCCNHNNNELSLRRNVPPPWPPGFLPKSQTAPITTKCNLTFWLPVYRLEPDIPQIQLISFLENEKTGKVVIADTRNRLIAGPISQFGPRLIPSYYLPDDDEDYPLAMTSFPGCRQCCSIIGDGLHRFEYELPSQGSFEKAIHVITRFQNRVLSLEKNEQETIGKAIRSFGSKTYMTTFKLYLNILSILQNTNQIKGISMRDVCSKSLHARQQDQVKQKESDIAFFKRNLPR